MEDIPKSIQSSLVGVQAIYYFKVSSFYIHLLIPRTIGFLPCFVYDVDKRSTKRRNGRCKMNDQLKFLDENRLLKAVEVASLLNISRSFAYQLLQSGVIPVVRIGKACRVRPQDLEAYIVQNIHCEVDGSQPHFQ
jgi:excisionase family DNA binding protein